jgi:hypothetical protein
MLFNKKYHKIVRTVKYNNNNIIRHSCWIPFDNKFSIKYEEKNWSHGCDLFVFECNDEDDISKLKRLVMSICSSLSVVDPENNINDRDDELNYIQIELWQCMIGKQNIPINTQYLMPVHVFLNHPNSCKDHLQKAKDNKEFYPKPKQLVTDKIKLIKKIFTHTENKFIFNESKTLGILKDG